MDRIYDDFKTYDNYKDNYIIENYIRHTYFDSVIATFDNLEDAGYFMDSNDIWDDSILLGVDHEGRAFYPSF